MIIAVPEAEADKVLADLKARNEACYQIGRVTKGSREVVLKGGVFSE
jgi:phosphoribosylformylglycinamidine cyclo-ligase